MSIEPTMGCVEFLDRHWPEWRLYTKSERYRNLVAAFNAGAAYAITLQWNKPKNRAGKEGKGS